jgi:hypothetical protein
MLRSTGITEFIIHHQRLPHLAIRSNHPSQPVINSDCLTQILHKSSAVSASSSDSPSQTPLQCFGELLTSSYRPFQIPCQPYAEPGTSSDGYSQIPCQPSPEPAANSNGSSPKSSGNISTPRPSNIFRSLLEKITRFQRQALK